jgi:hypothetical protein
MEKTTNGDLTLSNGDLFQITPDAYPILWNFSVLLV